MGLFERYLSVWVFICIASGVFIGTVAPGLVEIVSRFEYAQINLVIAILIWLMIYPMMVHVDFEAVKNIHKNSKGLLLTVIINWLIKPFTMFFLALLFFNYFYEGLYTQEEAKQYMAGMILLGIAPCTAMVFVWSQLTKGDPNYTLVQVSVNDIIMIFAFAPLAQLLLGMSDVFVPWNTLVLSVVLYVLVPLVAGYISKRIFLESKTKMDLFDRVTKPLSIGGLLLTVVLLFAFQAEKIIEHPLTIVLIAIPLLLQSYGIFSITYAIAWFGRIPHRISAPAAMIGTSNFFELAVAVAIGLFGLNSGAALATVVGVLVEVPVMLFLVAFANRTKKSFKLRAGQLT
ncbi:MAG: ACR3 family arsenite efflux transporter [Oligoflexales bacterium]